MCVAGTPLRVPTRGKSSRGERKKHVQREERSNLEQREWEIKQSLRLKGFDTCI
jgi:hypothetical protein